jgi:hypothetical protein
METVECIANVSMLPANNSDGVFGFDTGPANILMDAWCHPVWRWHHASIKIFAGPVSKPNTPSLLLAGSMLTLIWQRGAKARHWFRLSIKHYFNIQVFIV